MGEFVFGVNAFACEERTCAYYYTPTQCVYCPEESRGEAFQERKKIDIKGEGPTKRDKGRKNKKNKTVWLPGLFSVCLTCSVILPDTCIAPCLGELGVTNPEDEVLPKGR